MPCKQTTHTCKIVCGVSPYIRTECVKLVKVRLLLETSLFTWWVWFPLSNCRLNRTNSISMEMRNGIIPIDSNPSITVSSSTIDRGTPSVKNLRRTPSDQSSTYKKYSPTTTASSSPSILMFKQKRKWEISGASLETVESNVALSVSAQTNLDRNHANMGDNDTRPQMANNMTSSSETTLHHHPHPYPRTPSDSPAPGEVGETVAPSSGNSFAYIMVWTERGSAQNKT